MKITGWMGPLAVAGVLALGCGSHNSNSGAAGSSAGTSGNAAGASGSAAAGASGSNAVGSGAGSGAGTGAGTGGTTDGGTANMGTPVTCGAHSCPGQAGLAAQFGQTTCCLPDNSCGVKNANLGGGTCQPPATTAPKCPAPSGMLAGFGATACCDMSMDLCGIALMGSQCIAGGGGGRGMMVDGGMGGGRQQYHCDGTPVANDNDAGPAGG